MKHNLTHNNSSHPPLNSGFVNFIPLIFIAVMSVVTGIIVYQSQRTNTDIRSWAYPPTSTPIKIPTITPIRTLTPTVVPGEIIWDISESDCTSIYQGCYNSTLKNCTPAGVVNAGYCCWGPGGGAKKYPYPHFESGTCVLVTPTTNITPDGIVWGITESECLATYQGCYNPTYVNCTPSGVMNSGYCCFGPGGGTKRYPYPHFELGACFAVSPTPSSSPTRVPSPTVTPIRTPTPTSKISPTVTPIRTPTVTPWTSPTPTSSCHSGSGMFACYLSCCPGFTKIQINNFDPSSCICIASASSPTPTPRVSPSATPIRTPTATPKVTLMPTPTLVPEEGQVFQACTGSNTTCLRLTEESCFSEGKVGTRICTYNTCSKNPNRCNLDKECGTCWVPECQNGQTKCDNGRRFLCVGGEWNPYELPGACALTPTPINFPTPTSTPAPPAQSTCIGACVPNMLPCSNVISDSNYCSHSQANTRCCKDPQYSCLSHLPPVYDGIAYYSQRDACWKNIQTQYCAPLGNQICGPTTTTMFVHTFVDPNMNPVDMIFTPAYQSIFNRNPIDPTRNDNICYNTSTEDNLNVLSSIYNFTVKIGIYSPDELYQSYENGWLGWAILMVYNTSVNPEVEYLSHHLMLSKVEKKADNSIVNYYNDPYNGPDLTLDQIKQKVQEDVQRYDPSVANHLRFVSFVAALVKPPVGN
jgi:hypothetical protein